MTDSSEKLNSGLSPCMLLEAQYVRKLRLQKCGTKEVQGFAKALETQLCSSLFYDATFPIPTRTHK